jgi:hypothetical protein
MAHAQAFGNDAVKAASWRLRSRETEPALAAAIAGPDHTNAFVAPTCPTPARCVHLARHLSSWLACTVCKR